MAQVGEEPIGSMGSDTTLPVLSKLPRSIFDYVEGVMRWHNRVVAYALILVTDQYPPFRLSA